LPDRGSIVPWGTTPRCLCHPSRRKESRQKGWLRRMRAHLHHRKPAGLHPLVENQCPVSCKTKPPTLLSLSRCDTVYTIADEYDGRRAALTNFFILLEAHQNHPEAKSLGSEGRPCEFDTRRLLQRAHIVATGRRSYIGKESDRYWEEGEDISPLEFKAIHYKRKGYAVATNEQLRRIEAVRDASLCDVA
jgi:hypothetical protein